MSAGPVETEIKLRITDAAAGLGLIALVGALPKTGRLFEANMVYDTVACEIRGRGELLRLREVGDRCVLTWKGPGSAGKHKSREETEVLISDAGGFDLILRRLGFTPMFRYEKYRTEFGIRDQAGVITLDETPIGCFLELEGPPQWIDRCAAALGFSVADYLTLSYLSLNQEECLKRGVAVSDMVFRQEEDRRQASDGE